MKHRSLLPLLLAGCLAALSLTPLVKAQYTEFPATVAPGRFLLETEALSLVLDREGEEKYSGLALGGALLTTGLTHNWDIQLGAQLYLRQRYEDGSFTERQSGVGDVFVRTKWRFFTNDYVSVAILPYAKIPTSSDGVGNDHVEGGVALPWETYVFGGFLTINSMLDVSRLRNANDDGYETSIYFSSVATKELTRFISLYAELDGYKAPSGPWQSTLGVGAYLSFSDHLGVDLAVYRGLNRHAPDWNPVLRVNYEF